MTRRLGLLLVVASVISTMPLERARAADYPVLYRDLGLPEYPQATVEAVGRSNSNLHDGLRIKLKTQASSIQLRTFFEQKMTELGWVLQETASMRKMRKAEMLNHLPFNAAFCKNDGTVYQVTTVNLGTSRHVNITVNNGGNAC